MKIYKRVTCIIFMFVLLIALLAGCKESKSGGNSSVTQGNFPNGGNMPEGGFPGRQDGNMPDMEMMMEAMQIIQKAGGEITDEVREALKELGLTDEQIEMFSNMPSGGFPDGDMPNGFPG